MRVSALACAGLSAGFFRAFQLPKEAYGRLPARSSAVYCSANDARRPRVYAPTLDNTTTVLDRAREVLRLQGWIGEVQRTAHARDSADKRFDYYTPALAKRVCRLQARDFTNFGYPCWDGIKDTFRIL